MFSFVLVSTNSTSRTKISRFSL